MQERAIGRILGVLVFKSIRYLLSYLLFIVALLGSSPIGVAAVPKPSFFPPGQSSYWQGVDTRARFIYKGLKKYLGTPYRRGGSSLRGMDCSGFVRTAYQELFGIELPHGTAFQYPLPIFNKVSLKNLRAGDLIFFSPRGKTKRINHVGIYLSDGRFIHSARSEGVTVSSLSERYWKSRVCAARRVSNWDETPEKKVDHFSRELTREWEPQSIATLQFYELQPSSLSLSHLWYLPNSILEERGFGSEVNLQLALLNLPWTLKLTAFREYYFLLNHADIYNRTPFQDENNPSYSYLDSSYAQGLRVTSDFQPWEYLRVSPSLTYLDSDLKIYDPSLPSFSFGINLSLTPVTNDWALSMAVQSSDLKNFFTRDLNPYEERRPIDMSLIYRQKINENLFFTGAYTERQLPLVDNRPLEERKEDQRFSIMINFTY